MRCGDAHRNWDDPVRKHHDADSLRGHEGDVDTEAVRGAGLIEQDQPRSNLRRCELRRCPPIKGAMFDSSITMAAAAAHGAGVALLPVAMFERDLSLGRLVQLFDIRVSIGDYWLTSLKSKAETDAMRAFRQWIIAGLGPGKR
jgi:DNA-binding transcriptional LysR family regulator